MSAVITPVTHQLTFNQPTCPKPQYADPVPVVQTSLYRWGKAQKRPAYHSPSPSRSSMYLPWECQTGQKDSEWVAVWLHQYEDGSWYAPPCLEFPQGGYFEAWQAYWL